MTERWISDLTFVLTLAGVSLVAACNDAALLNANDDAGASSLAPSWSVVQPSGGSTLYAIWGSSADDIYVVGARTILHSLDHGASWQTQTAPGLDAIELHGVWGSGPSDVYAVGKPTSNVDPQNSIVLHTADRGATWIRLPDPPQGGALSVWGTASDDVYVAGKFGVVRTTDHGATFQVSVMAQSVGDYWTSYDSLCDAGGEVFVLFTWCCPSGEIMSTADHGATWTHGCGIDPGFGELRFTRMFGFRDGSRWALGRDISHPGFIARVGMGENQSPRWDMAQPCNSHDVVHQSESQLDGLWGSAPADIWVSGQNATYLHSTDGTNFTPVAGAPSFSSTAIWGFGPNEAYFVGGLQIARAIL